jgi:hypothetical protein
MVIAENAAATAGRREKLAKVSENAAVRTQER